MLPCPKSVEITINIINTNNTDNIKVFCYCGSGKKYKKCCINKKSDLLRKQLNSIDEHVCKAAWLYNMGKSKKASRLYRIAWFDVQEICKAYSINSIDEYDDTYKGYDCLLNWIQDIK